MSEPSPLRSREAYQKRSEEPLQKGSQEQRQKVMEPELPPVQPETGVRYAGVWRAGTGLQVLVTDADWSTFESKWRELSGQGLRLIAFRTYVMNSQRVYAGVWRPGSDAHDLRVGLDWSTFEAKATELSGQ